MYGRPLVSGTTVVAATEQNNVYALYAATRAVRWKSHLGTPVLLSQLQCGNIDPNGITSTPIIDAAAGTVYAVAMLDAPARRELFALHLSDGSVVWPGGAGPANRRREGEG